MRTRLSTADCFQKVSFFSTSTRGRYYVLHDFELMFPLISLTSFDFIHRITQWKPLPVWDLKPGIRGLFTAPLLKSSTLAGWGVIMYMHFHLYVEYLYFIWNARSKLKPLEVFSDKYLSQQEIITLDVDLIFLHLKWLFLAVIGTYH